VTFAQVGAGSAALRLAAEPATRDTRLQADLRRDALAASVVVPAFLAQGFTDLLGFVDGVAADWRGFPGARRWESPEGELVLGARHEFRRLRLRVTMRVAGPGWGDEGWTAWADVDVDPAEELPRFAAELRAVLEG
jgi:hypothetical protein